MRTFKLFIIFFAILALAMTACGGGSSSSSDDDNSTADDDAGDDVTDDTADDTADDTSADDTTGDDADDDTGLPLTVTNLTTGACSGDKGFPDPATEPHDMVELTWQNGVLTVTHSAAVLNCGFDLQVAAQQFTSGIKVVETDVGSPANCMCSIDLSYDIEGITPGDYNFELDGLATPLQDASLLAKLDVTLDDGSNWKWGIPTIDLLKAQGTPPYTAGDPITIRVNVCYLEDQASVQFAYRVGFPGFDTDGIYIMTTDKRSLDDPVEPDPTCVFKYTDITIPDAGSYYLRTNSYRFDTLVWELVNSADAVVVQ